jgi:hypothetical protein
MSELLKQGLLIRVPRKGDLAEIWLTDKGRASLSQSENNG